MLYSKLLEYYPSAVEENATENKKADIYIYLEKIYFSAVGYYSVALDIPGQGLKQLSEYVCLSPDTKIISDRRVYYYSETEETVTIKSDPIDSFEYIPLNYEIHVYKTDKAKIKYHFP
jgi:hypothetical protein